MEIIQSIQNRIYEIRGQRVMLDFDLAQLYEVETKRLNEAVKRNLKRFPDDFMFRLSAAEWESIRAQNVTTSEVNKEMRSQIATASFLKSNPYPVLSPIILFCLGIYQIFNSNIY